MKASRLYTDQSNYLLSWSPEGESKQRPSGPDAAPFFDIDPPSEGGEGPEKEKDTGKPLAAPLWPW